MWMHSVVFPGLGDGDDGGWWVVGDVCKGYMSLCWCDMYAHHSHDSVVARNYCSMLLCRQCITNVLPLMILLQVVNT